MRVNGAVATTLADRLYVEDLPATAPAPGRPVVLIHGWLCDSSDWSAQLGWLTAAHRTILLDLPGHGRSSNLTLDFTVRRLAGDVAALLDELGVAGAVLIGHSAGAEVAAALAAQRPRLCDALIVIDPAYGVPAAGGGTCRELSRRLACPAAQQVASDYFAGLDSAETPAELAQAHRSRPHAYSPQVISRSYDDLAFGAGTLRIRPATDRLLTRRAAPLLAFYRNHARAATGGQLARLPHDRVVVFDGAGHWLHQEQPQRFAATVDDWLPAGDRQAAPAPAVVTTIKGDPR